MNTLILCRYWNDGFKYKWKWLSLKHNTLYRGDKFMLEGRGF